MSRGGWSYQVIPEDEPKGRVKVCHYDTTPYSWEAPYAKTQPPLRDAGDGTRPPLRRSTRNRQPPGRLQVDPRRTAYGFEREEHYDDETDEDDDEYDVHYVSDCDN